MTNCIVHEIIHAFLLAEYNSLKSKWKKEHINLIINKTHEDLEIFQIMTQPNFLSGKENEARYRALMSIRRDLWFNFPPDTQWIKCDFGSINIEKIKLLCPKKEEELVVYGSPENLNLSGIILFEQENNYYVIEGNNRMSGYFLHHN